MWVLGIVLILPTSMDNASTYIRLLEVGSALFMVVFWSPRADFQQTYLSVVEHRSISSRAQHKPVWTANPDYPITAQGSLTICDSGSVCLRDGNGTIAWSAGINVFSVLLTLTGNLIMQDAFVRTVWQSFQHPLDTLVQNQRLVPGMTLKSNSSVYSATMNRGGLVFFRKTSTSSSTESIPYSSSKDFREALVSPCPLDKDIAAVLVGDYAAPADTFSLQASCKQLNISILSISRDFISDYVRLDPDGRLRTYQFDDYGNVEHHAYLELNTQNATGVQPWLGDCVDPEACGVYGICTPPSSKSQNRSCACPSNSTNSSESSQVFFQIDAKDAVQGCALALPIQCNTFASQHQKLLEYKNITSGSMLIEGWNTNTRSLEECQEHCISNCSCAAAFYDRNSSTCLLIPVNYVLTLINVADSRYSAFLKVPDLDRQGPTAPSRVIPSSNGSATPDITNSSHINIGVLIPATVVPAAFLLICSSLAVYFCILKMSSREDDELVEKEILAIAAALPSRFSLQDLEIATDKFTRKLGAGGFGSVYEGALKDGRRVAVKKLDIERQGHKQFLAEVVTMGSINHLNIVKLLGFCSERSKRLLVYEYMENGSLDKWIYGNHDEHPTNMLDWAQRFAVAIGTARGLTYLHDECINPILHLDIKPENILLDASFVPKVADFGLSRPTERAASMVMTGARGTPGYIAPEWLHHCGATRKCDVYSFGMVLLQLVGGRKIISVSKIHESGENKLRWHLGSWAFEMLDRGKMLELVDERLEGVFDTEQARRMVLVALWCIQDDPKLRPEMAQVMKMLEGTMEIQGTPPRTGGEF